MRNVGDDLIRGMENALAHVRGTKRAARETVVAVQIPDAVDVAAIRRRLGLTQNVFALRFGFSISNIRNWEQGCREPEGSARAYLTVIDRNPTAVEAALTTQATAPSPRRRRVRRGTDAHHALPMAAAPRD